MPVRLKVKQKSHYKSMFYFTDLFFISKRQCLTFAREYQIYIYTNSAIHV